MLRAWSCAPQRAAQPQRQKTKIANSKNQKWQCLACPHSPKQPGTCDGKKQHQQHLIWVFLHLAAGTVSPVTDKEQTHSFLPWWGTSPRYLTQPAGRCPSAGICLSRARFSTAEIGNTPSPEQSRRANTGAGPSEQLQSSGGYSDIPKPPEGKGVQHGAHERVF